ncbi:type II toxin-antitoxin system RelE/ParE family toxin [bacterium]|nr:type II toxin-antitoxin system RelE/ParE family toxin [bacterium]
MEILWHKEAEKELKKIEKDIARRIYKKVSLLATNPYLGEKLKGYTFPFYRLRVGNYRIIYLIEEKKIKIYRIGKREEIYKRIKE